MTADSHPRSSTPSYSRGLIHGLEHEAGLFRQLEHEMYAAEHRHKPSASKETTSSREERARRRAVRFEDPPEKVIPLPHASGRIEELPDEPTIRTTNPSDASERAHVTVSATGSSASQPTSKSSTPPIANSNLPEHPFRNVRDATYAPPSQRNFAAPASKVPVPPQKNEAAYKSLVPIYDPKHAENVFKRCLEAPISLTHEELLALAPEIRHATREACSTRRVPVESEAQQSSKTNAQRRAAFLADMPDTFFAASAASDIRQTDVPPPGAIVIQDPVELYLRTQSEDKPRPLLCTSAEGLAIRTIEGTFQAGLKAACILDSGSAIVSMSEGLCHALGLAYDPKVILDMQSANGEVNPSLGLARNVPVKFGTIVVYLQFHIIRSPAYDAILGRPFDVLTESVVQTFGDGADSTTKASAVCASNPSSRNSFSRLEDLIPDQGEVTLVISSPPSKPDHFTIDAYTSLLPDFNHENLDLLYLSACDPSLLGTDSLCDPSFPYQQLYNYTPNFDSLLFSSSAPAYLTENYTSFSIHSHVSQTPPSPIPIYVASKKKYKPVSKKVKLVLAPLPDQFRIVRDIKGNPLADMPPLPHHPPPFVPTSRYTEERRRGINALHSEDFLWPQERSLMHTLISQQNDAFAWDESERGQFCPDFFPPVTIPVIPHKPWVQKNLPIPPGLFDEICAVIRKKEAAGVYEPSNSSYRSRWFCVVKKDGKSLRLVHSLEPLNAVTIAHSGVPPFTEHLAESFAGRACGGILDLFVSYDARLLDPSSRDLTTFSTPFGARRLTTLPMGWTNLVPIFHEDVTFILQPEIPEYTRPFIDDVPVRGPATRYELPDGGYETIPENDGIRRFVWEHLNTVNRIVQRVKYSGGTFSGTKSILCAAEYTVVGHRCTYAGRVPEPGNYDKVLNWGPCANLSEVRAFLGTIGVAHSFIPNFGKRAWPLTQLTRKGATFEWGPEQIAAQDDLKRALATSPALRPLDYSSPAAVILAVDTSKIAVGYLLAQCDIDKPSQHFYARFGSIVLNKRESAYSQAKLELYGLYRSLKATKRLLIGIRNLVVEVNARYIRGMLNNPDEVPSASMNRWIVTILTFHFELVHVPGVQHGPDGLSRRPRQPGDEQEPPDEEDDWIDRLNGLLHLAHVAATIVVQLAH
ncbi:hypothetical protein ONZ51_g10947 [Trametes cubensis]|uniref:Reverse transcriptase/retrotransposon-derived protein RNase H-like domain-containing protein n=1 Tax=Trametes cubensis TaxID=1111947 RepID=A0AAD7X8D3_9APHY|nr:hypothetical protein ONZ51_g10947 [Trametes cubensis]